MMNHAPSAQQVAIFNWFQHGKGNLVVRARAGTGKTTTMLAGIDLAPEQSILALAFNKSIANEFSARLNNHRAEAKTCHGLGFKFCNYNWKGIKVCDGCERADALSRASAPDAPDAILRLISKLHTKAREIIPFCPSVDRMLDLASQFGDECMPDEEWEDSGWDASVVAQAALRALGLAKTRPADNFIDFADMIFLPLVNNWIRPWYNLVVVDEAQDMTTAQLMIAQRACKRGGRICIVGDDRQAIYAFRGADSGSLDRLKAELKAQELGLNITYRCPKLVVELAAKLVPDFTAAPTAPTGEILKAARDKMESDAKEGDFILSRTNAPLIKVCMALLKRGVRARIKGRDIGKGITALVRKLRAKLITDVEPRLGEWLSKETARALAKLSEDAAKARIEFVTDQHDVIVALTEGCATVAELETRITELFADDAERAAVMCSTVHRAKGLETGRVYLLEGTFRKVGAGIEEDNIRYVGITRAKATLVWVSGFEKAATPKE